MFGFEHVVQSQYIPCPISSPHREGQPISELEFQQGLWTWSQICLYAEWKTLYKMIHKYEEHKTQVQRLSRMFSSSHQLSYEDYMDTLDAMRAHPHCISKANWESLREQWFLDTLQDLHLRPSLCRTLIPDMVLAPSSSSSPRTPLYKKPKKCTQDNVSDEGKHAEDSLAANTAEPLDLTVPPNVLALSSSSSSAASSSFQAFPDLVVSQTQTSLSSPYFKRKTDHSLSSFRRPTSSRYSWGCVDFYSTTSHTDEPHLDRSETIV